MQVISQPVKLATGQLRCSSNLEFIVKRAATPAPTPANSAATALLNWYVISRPNGQGAYKDGTLACDHLAVFEYADSFATLETVDKTTNLWRRISKDEVFASL